MTLSDHLQAIAEGRGTTADVDAALRLSGEAWDAFDHVRSDWLDEAATRLEQSGLAQHKPSHRLRAALFRHKGDGQLAMIALLASAGDPPEADVVRDALDLDAVGASPEAEERFFLAHAASLGDPLRRAALFAHVAAAHSNGGLDVAANAWMDRAVAAAPGTERVPALAAYFVEHGLSYARGLIR